MTGFVCDGKEVDIGHERAINADWEQRKEKKMKCEKIRARFQIFQMVCAKNSMIYFSEVNGCKETSVILQSICRGIACVADHNTGYRGTVLKSSLLSELQCFPSFLELKKFRKNFKLS